MSKKSIKIKNNIDYRAQGCIIFMFLIVLYSLVFVSAYTNTTFNNSLITENISFVGVQNHTRYLSIPENNYVFNSYMNLSFNNTNLSMYIGNSKIFNINQTTTVKDQNDSYLSSTQYINSGQSLAQSFTATSSYIVDKVEIPISNRLGSTHINVEIQGVNSTGYPDGIILGYNYTWNTDEVTTGATLIWYNVTIPQKPTINFVTNYTIVYYWQSGSAQIGYNNTNNRIDGNKKFYTVPPSNNTWVIEASKQLGFRLYSAIGLVNISLMSVNMTSAINNYLISCSYLSGICDVPFIFENLENDGIMTYKNLFVNATSLLINNESYNATTYETKRESYYINVTSAYNYSLVSGNFVYNNIPYYATTVYDGINLLFNVSIDIPTDIKSALFYWNLSIVNTTDTTYLITAPNNQTIINIQLSSCNTTVNNTVLNFTFADEETLLFFNGTINAMFNYSIGDSSITKLYSYNNLSIREVDFCITPANLNFTSDISINYNNYNSTAGYGTRYFNQQKYLLNNSLTNITLYSLLTTSSTTFIILVQDNNLLPVGNVIVETYKFNPTLNKFILVQSGLTDGNGQTTAQLIINTVNYKFIVKRDGEVIYTSPIQAAIPTTAPYTITLAIGSIIPNPLIPLTQLSDLSSNIYFNKSTNQVTWIYQDSSGSFNNSLFIVAIQNYSNGRDYIVCNMSSTNPNAIEICDLTITGNRTGVYYANGYITRGSITYLVSGISFSVEDFSSLMGGLGVILGIIIIMICALSFLGNEIVGVWLTTISIIVVNILGLISFGALFITGVIALAIVLTIIFKQ